MAKVNCWPSFICNKSPSILRSQSINCRNWDCDRSSLSLSLWLQTPIAYCNTSNCCFEEWKLFTYLDVRAVACCILQFHCAGACFNFLYYFELLWLFVVNRCVSIACLFWCRLTGEGLRVLIHVWGESSRDALWCPTLVMALTRRLATIFPMVLRNLLWTTSKSLNFWWCITGKHNR